MHACTNYTSTYHTDITDLYNATSTHHINMTDCTLFLVHTTLIWLIVQCYKYTSQWYDWLYNATSTHHIDISDLQHYQYAPHWYNWLYVQCHKYTRMGSLDIISNVNIYNLTIKFLLVFMAEFSGKTDKNAMCYAIC